MYAYGMEAYVAVVCVFEWVMCMHMVWRPMWLWCVCVCVFEWVMCMHMVCWPMWLWLWCVYVFA